jgi:hypothetical protein
VEALVPVAVLVQVLVAVLVEALEPVVLRPEEVVEALEAVAQLLEE